ncbi:GNAT family N-acetyltransferase [Rhizobium lusitanum]|uniref:RimJ/RimL family protein N-acetyltransferase n=1 Tax=Rhizobium lusitanum TaxID=293958 RepID=A0A7X0MC76_9HYPH|nr:GNAT family N-acetyltransferase [Rhizobium lusitanum]MBB6483625.1 RimJ/RimL family protein N-acetyltransferase [Rhizobium lusitanum]
MHLSTQRTILRPFAPGDAPDIFACMSPAITRFMAWEPPSTPGDFEKVWRAWLDAARDGTEFHFVARSCNDNRFLGIVGVHAARSDTPELGIWLRSDVHGKGLGRELIGAVIGWASGSLPVRHFEYPVAEENVASRRIAETYGGEVRARRSDPKYQSVVYHIPPRRT